METCSLPISNLNMQILSLRISGQTHGRLPGFSPFFSNIIRVTKKFVFTVSIIYTFRFKSFRVCIYLIGFKSALIISNISLKWHKVKLLWSTVLIKNIVGALCIYKIFIIYLRDHHSPLKKQLFV